MEKKWLYSLVITSMLLWNGVGCGQHIDSTPTSEDIVQEHSTSTPNFSTSISLPATRTSVPAGTSETATPSATGTTVSDDNKITYRIANNLELLITPDIETQLYLATTHSDYIKLWRYTLTQGTLELLVQWPTVSDQNLNESVSPEDFPVLAAKFGISQDELSKWKEEICGIDISRSPQGRYLAISLSVFLSTSEWVGTSTWAAKNIIYLLDSQNQDSPKLIWSQWESGNVTDFRWPVDESKLLFQFIHPGYTDPEVWVYDIESSQIIVTTPGEHATWHTDSNYISFLSQPSQENPDDYFWTNTNVESQESQTIELPEVKGDPYVLVDAIGVIRLLYLGMGKGYYVISELEEDGLTFREVAGINNLFVSDPHVNATGSQLAYQATMRNGEKALGLYDLRTGDQSYVSLNGYDIGDLEWSQTADVILTTGFAEGIRGRQIILLDIEKRVMNVLPKFPELSEDELITGVTW